MKITLYKNCIFTRSYSEVCDCRIKDTNGKTARDRYLEGLTKEVFEIDSVYSTNSGTINVPIKFPNSTDSVYDFNYLKIEFESITRYCFIDDIQFMNYIAVIYYSEDIWHSYSGVMKLRKGFLQNSTFTAYGTKYLQDFNIPAIHDSLKPLIITPFENVTSYWLIAQAQKANLSTSGSVTQRTVRTVAIKTGSTFNASWWATQQSAMQLITQQAIAQNNLTCEFGNITIVPSYMMSATLVSDDKFWTFTTGGVTYEAHEIGETSSITEIYTKVLEYNENRKNIGTYATDYEYRTAFWLPNDNTGRKISIGIFNTYTDFKILLTYQGQVIDVTSSFVFDMPFSSITGAEAQQAKISREMQTINGAVQIVAGAVDIGASIASFGIDTGVAQTTQYMATHTMKGKPRKRYTAKNKVMLAQGQAQEAQAGVDLAGGIGGGIQSMVKGVTGIVEANASVHQSNTGTFAIGVNSLNCKYGIVEKIFDDAKTDYVENIIRNVGYSVNAFVSDEVFATNGMISITGYRAGNTIKFGWVNIYGDFPQSVCETLKDILISGTKIWYVESSI